MGKRHQRRQDVFILTETNDVTETALTANIGYVESPETVEAWGLNKNQQAKNIITGRFAQLLSERSCIPIEVFRNGHSESKIIGNNISTIASQTEDREQAVVENRKDKDSRLLWVGIITLIIAIAFLLVLWKAIL